jgi:hypothetical protein
MGFRRNDGDAAMARTRKALPAKIDIAHLISTG